MNYHVPVLLEESLNFLVSNRSGNYYDGTVGFGGHSTELLKRLDNNATLVATDKDINAFSHCKELFKDDTRVKLYHSSFINIDEISNIEFIENYDGILADLGVSSFQLDDVDSGFTYKEETTLDLRMDKSEGVPASKIVNSFDETRLANIIYEFGEEKRSRQIARRIIESRKKQRINKTTDLKKIIEEITPERQLNKTLSRVFQALRIYVNDELGELKVFLDKSVNRLNTGGRIAIITFHSLEDRIVKDFFREEAKDCICPPAAPVCVCNKEPRLKVITKKPVIPSDDEISRNKRSRSAKLRIAEKI